MVFPSVDTTAIDFGATICYKFVVYRCVQNKMVLKCAKYPAKNWFWHFEDVM